MPNTSHILPLIIMITVLVFPTYSRCPANTEIEQFYQLSAQMSNMRQQKAQLSLNTQRNAYNYVLNYPLSLLSRELSANIQSILSIQKFDIQNSQKVIHYRVKHIKSSTALLITFQYYQAKYRDFKIGILLFSKSLYSSIILPGIISQTNIQGRLSITSTINVTKTWNPNITGIFTFINGINIALKNIQNPQYQVSMNRTFNDQTRQIKVIINTGEGTILSEIYITYVLFERSTSHRRIQISALQASFYSIGEGTHDHYLYHDIIAPSKFLIGISEFKIKKGLGSFSQEFNLTQFNILRLSTNQPLGIIKLAVFRVGNLYQQLCGHCTEFVRYVQNASQCIPKCTERYGAIFNKCITCPKQLNIAPQLFGPQCECPNDYKLHNGKCIPSSQSSPASQSKIKFPIYMVLFSTITTQCIQANTFKNSSGGCSCKPGYQRRTVYNVNQCVSICTNGYYNGQSCVSCPIGTYPWQQLQTCLKCCQNCQTCKTQFTCQQCQAGFSINGNGQCIQICGDGIKMYAQCDDGNIYDGDGCSSMCKIQEGYTCVPDQNGRSTCTNQQYKIVRKSIMFRSGNLIIQYICTPPLPRLYSTQELLQLITVNYMQSAPKNSYIAQNPNNLSEIRIVGTYGGLAPVLPAIIEATLRIPKYAGTTNNQYATVFNQRITYNFVNVGGRTFARNINTNKDVIH